MLQRRKDAAQTLEQRAEAEGLSLMFQLALRTAMRMREIYTQIRIEDKTIYQKAVFDTKLVRFPIVAGPNKKGHLHLLCRWMQACSDAP